MENRTLWLVKDNNDVVNWCNCEKSVAGRFPQASCPWCGCGWLFACAFCHKCFMFARFEWFDEPAESLARRVMLAKWSEVTDEDVREL
ncbi:MAG: hypothetical protein ACOYN0_16115, partial [Phycisphaerales bacterium]